MTDSTDRPTPSGFDHAAWQAAKTERSTRNDLVSVLGAAVFAAGAVVVTLVLRLLDVFGTDGTRVPVFFDAVDTALPGAAGAGSFTVDRSGSGPAACSRGRLRSPIAHLVRERHAPAVPGCGHYPGRFTTVGRDT